MLPASMVAGSINLRRSDRRTCGCVGPLHERGLAQNFEAPVHRAKWRVCGLSISRTQSLDWIESCCLLIPRLG